MERSTNRMKKKENRDFDFNDTGIGFNPAIMKILSGEGRIFLNYLKDLGLAKESNLMVISPGHQYYHKETDLRNVKTILNLEKLNLIKHLDRFLKILVRIMPPDSSFIGCFADVKSVKKKSIFHWLKKIPDRMKIYPDPGKEYRMDRDNVANLFTTYGFRIMNMKEINGLTYFHIQNIVRSEKEPDCLTS